MNVWAEIRRRLQTNILAALELLNTEMDRGSLTIDVLVNIRKAFLNPDFKSTLIGQAKNAPTLKESILRQLTEIHSKADEKSDRLETHRGLINQLAVGGSAQSHRR